MYFQDNIPNPVLRIVVRANFSIYKQLLLNAL